MPKQTHIVHKQVYELHTNTETNARKLQQNLQQVNLQGVLPAVNAVLDDLFHDGDVVQIDKLEIDLGTISSESAPGYWTELITRRLQEKLRPYASHKMASEQEFFSKRQPVSRHLLETWIGFLESGMLPSQSLFRSLEAIKKELLLSDESQQELLRLAMLELDPYVFVPRLIANTTREELAFCLNILQPFISSQEWTQILATTSVILESEWNKFTWVQKESLFGLRQWQHIILVEFGQTVVMEANHNMPLDFTEAENLVQEIICSTRNKLLVQESLREVQQAPADVKKWSVEIGDMDKERATNVANAGLCLLAPWLGKFFNITGLCIGNSFKDDISQQHAVFLLYFIATGETDATEEKLVFAKLLCGWPLQMPCINAYEITELEKQEAVDLLQSVITNWPVLKNTSPDGLRESFIQRSGKLTTSADHYLLQPEQRGIDILIDHISWGFRNVFLPWMDRRLVVEWF